MTINLIQELVYLIIEMNRDADFEYINLELGAYEAKVHINCAPIEGHRLKTFHINSINDHVEVINFIEKLKEL